MYSEHGIEIIIEGAKQRIAQQVADIDAGQENLITLRQNACYLPPMLEQMESQAKKIKDLQEEVESLQAEGLHDTGKRYTARRLNVIAQRARGARVGGLKADLCGDGNSDHNLRDKNGRVVGTVCYAGDALMIETASKELDALVQSVQSLERMLVQAKVLPIAYKDLLNTIRSRVWALQSIPHAGALDTAIVQLFHYIQREQQRLEDCEHNAG